VPVN